jgi:hypothetical protein
MKFGLSHKLIGYKLELFPFLSIGHELYYN